MYGKWTAGRNFVTAMSDALDRCDRVVALFSAAYFERERYTTEEWSAVLVHAPGLPAGRLVPVRVEDVPGGLVPAVLRPLVYRDLFGLDEVDARRALLAAVEGPRSPDGEPVFPGGAAPGDLGLLGGAGPRLPGSLPGVWNLPARNPGFTGRERMLAAVRQRLAAGGTAVVQALHGMGGVGKTQLAAEYAHLFAGSYDLAWWISAERAGLLGEQVAALGTALGWVQAGTPIDTARAVVLAELRQRDRWLLVFDNAESPEDVMGWLPGGAGHVLITSRARGCDEVAVPVQIDVLARPESVTILQDRVPGLSPADAGELAGALGDLPLAVVQAAGYMAGTGMGSASYLELLATRAGVVLDQGRPATYPQPLATATVLAYDRVQAQDPAAAWLARVCAFLAPEPVPARWFTAAADDLPGVLGERAADRVAWPQVLARLNSSALARVDQDRLVMHRLTQAIIRGHLPSGQAAATRELAATILTASHPGDEGVPSTWPGWARLLPHLLALDPATTRGTSVRGLADHAAWYLLQRGDARTAHDLANGMCRQWHDIFGPDDASTLAAAHALAAALHDMGRYGEARQLFEDTLARRRRVLGEDHPRTLASATNLATCLRALGEVQAARELDEDTVARCRRVRGDDHPDTLASASDVAADLRALGEA
jgi:hypothetical protein